MPKLFILGLAIYCIVVAAAPAWAVYCTTTCYNVGNQRICNTTCN